MRARSRGTPERGGPARRRSRTRRGDPHPSGATVRLPATMIIWSSWSVHVPGWTEAAPRNHRRAASSAVRPPRAGGGRRWQATTRAHPARGGRPPRSARRSGDSRGDGRGGRHRSTNARSAAPTSRSAPPPYWRRRRGRHRRSRSRPRRRGRGARDGLVHAAPEAAAEQAADTAMPSVPPTSRTTSFMAEPMPALARGSAPMIASVAGDMARPMPVAHESERRGDECSRSISKSGSRRARRRRAPGRRRR